MQLTEGIANLLQVIHRRAGADEVLDGPVGAPDGLGNLVDILGLDDGPEVILEKLREVVFRT